MASVRRSLPLLVLVAVTVTMGPGLVAYPLLRWVGASQGLAGLSSLMLIMAAMVGFAGWLFAGGARHGRS